MVTELLANQLEHGLGVHLEETNLAARVWAVAVCSRITLGHQQEEAVWRISSTQLRRLKEMRNMRRG
jgi:hypothetical protein